MNSPGGTISVDSFKVVLSNALVKMEAVYLRSSMRSLSHTNKKKKFLATLAKTVISKKYLVCVTRPTVSLDKKIIKIWVGELENSNAAALKNFRIM